MTMRTVLLVPVITAAMLLVGCSYTRYHVAYARGVNCTVPPARCPPLQALAAPITEEKADGTAVLRYPGTKMLKKSVGPFVVDAGIEELVVILKESGWIKESYRTMQAIERHEYYVGNISGHGDFSGWTTSKTCEKYGSREVGGTCRDRDVSEK